MKLGLPKLPRTGDEPLRRFAADVLLAMEQIAALPSSQGHYVTDDNGSEDLVLKNAVVSRFKHRLGKKLRGWAIRDVRRKDGTAFGAGANVRIVRVTKTTTAVAREDVDLWLDVQGFGEDVIARVWVD